jgi:hypothetical protein
LWNINPPVSNVKRNSENCNHIHNIGFQACSKSVGGRRYGRGGGQFNLGRGGRGFGCGCIHGIPRLMVEIIKVVVGIMINISSPLIFSTIYPHFIVVLY